MSLSLDLSLTSPKISFSPIEIPDLKLWLDATDINTISLNGPLVTAWSDKSGSGNDFAQTVALNQPTLDPDAINFAGSLIHMIAGSNYIFSTGTGLSMFFLVKGGQVGDGNPKFIFDFGGLNSDGYGLGYAKDELIGYTPVGHGGVSKTKAIPSNTAYRTVGMVSKFGVDQRMYVDNSLEDTATIAGLSQITAAEVNENPTRILTGGPMTVGLQSKTGSETLRDFTGSLKVALVYTRDVSNIERTNIHNYMASLI